MNRRDIQDHPVVRFLTVLCDLLIVNLLWVICSLPIVTIGASTKAMYSIMLKLARKEPVSTIREYFQALREGFVPSLILWVITALALAIFVADLLYASVQVGSSRILFIVASAVSGAVSLSLATWSFSLAASFENTVKGYLKNSLAMAFVSPGQTIIMWCLYAFPVLFFILIPRTAQAVVAPLYIMMGATLPCYFVAQLQQKVYDRINAQQSAASGEEEQEDE